MVQYMHPRRRVEYHTGKRPSSSWISPLSIVSHTVVAIVAFYLGLVTGTGRATRVVDGTSSQRQMVADTTSSSSTKRQTDTTNTLFPSDIESLFAGGATVPREDFIQQYDIGVPWDEPVRGAKDVLMLYCSSSTLPNGHIDKGGTSNVVHYTSALNATANCNSMKIILTEPKHQNVCIALVPQWESYHVHHMMRLKPEDDKSDNPYIMPSYPLRYVSRRHEITSGGMKFGPQFPESYQLRKYWPMLIDYLQKLESTTARIKPLAEQVAGKGNTIVIMVCNFGQSELLVNFVCSARSRKLDLSMILVFATDNEVSELAKALGMTVFDVEDAFGEMPKTAAQQYGDRSFMGMMMSKVYCVHLINALGYDLLFQDVDVIWKRNALEYFHSPESGNFDFYFQDDGSHSNRYTPYSPNTGFYYVRHNPRTKYFFEVFIRMGELIMASGSHQSVLNGLLTEQASSTGLRVKVFQRDSELGRAFPGGYHYHKRKNFMKDILRGKRKPYIFHMSWTENKENKRKFYQQLGDWYVEDACVGKPLKDISISDKNDLSKQCCSAEPIVVCHYQDKPSKIPCKESPMIDYDGKSFW